MMRSARQQERAAPPPAAQAPAAPAAPQAAPETPAAGLFDPDPQAAAAYGAEPEAPAQPGEPADPTAEPADPDATPPPALDPNARVRVKVDGKEVEVPLAEALAGYSREQDYRQKTMRAAERERVREAEIAATQAERQHAAAQLDRALNEVSSMLLPEADMDRLLETNPDAYHRERRRREKVAVAIEERVRLAEADARAYNEGLKRQTEAEAEKLFHVKPEWKDPKVYARVQDEMREYAVSTGFSHQDVNNVRDHRMMLILEKAMRYDKLLASKPEPVRPNGAAQQSPAPLRPGTTGPRTAPGTAIVREAAASFNEKPTLKSALAMLSAHRSVGRR
jgi:hypothetical protein